MNVTVKIITILKKELFALEDIKKTAQKEQTLLIKIQGDAIGEVAKDLEGKIMHLNTLETEKNTLLRHLKIATIQELAEKLPIQETSIILHLNTRIQNLIEELRQINNTSKVFLEKNRNFLDYNLNILTAVVSTPTYIKDNKEAIEPLRQKMFDTTV